MEFSVNSTTIADSSCFAQSNPFFLGVGSFTQRHSISYRQTETNPEGVGRGGESCDFLSGIDKLFCGCFFNLKLGSVAGHVPKSRKKYRIVGIRPNSNDSVANHGDKKGL